MDGIKSIIVIFFIMLYSVSWGQSLDSEIINFVQEKKLLLKSSKKQSVKIDTKADSLITFYSDTIVLKFSIRVLSKIKSKDDRRQILYKKEVDKIRSNYKNGIDSIKIDEMSWTLEALIWGDALLSGKATEIIMNGEKIKWYTCKTYSDSLNGKGIFHSFYNERNIVFVAYSRVICWGPKFREEGN